MEQIIFHKKIPQIVCMDSNFNQDIGELMPNVFAQGFCSVLPKKPTTPKGKEYDKIITSKEWKCTSSKIIPGNADHFLCFAEVGF